MFAAVLSLALALAGVWFARRQVYLNRRYIVWRSVAFDYVYKSPLNLATDDEWEQQLAGLVKPMVVDVSIELLSSSDWCAERDWPDGKSLPVEAGDCPLRVRAVGATRFAGSLQGDSEFAGTILATPECIGLFPLKVRPQEPILISLLAGGGCEYVVETDLPDTRSWECGRAGTLPSKYLSKVPPEGLRTIWPPFDAKVEEAVPKKKFDRRTTFGADLMAALRSWWGLLKFFSSCIIVCYVAISIYADVNGMTNRNVELELLRLFEENKMLIGKVAQSIFQGLVYLVMGIAAVGYLRNRWRRRRSLRPLMRRRVDLLKPQDLLMSAEIFLLSPAAEYRLGRALERGKARAVQRSAIDAREQWLKGALA